MQVYMETYGCTANKSDEATLSGILIAHGHQVTTDVNKADFLLLLTCTVVNTTEQRMLSRFKQLLKYQKPLIIAGCMATVQQPLFTSINPDVQFLKPGKLHYILRLIGENTERKISTPRFSSILAPISLSEGCLGSCSYCITKKARGTLKSRPIPDIIQDIQSAVQQGCKEIQLTSQDTATYGMDIHSSLDQLINMAVKLPGDFRIRIGMMNPYHVLDILDQLISIYQHKQVYSFLHLPIQSGSNDILSAMNRNYTKEEYLYILKHFRNYYPDLTLATDVIIGFPGETDEQFQQTVNVLHTMRPDIVNITRFSARPQTTAKKMKQRIPTHIVKQRSQQLTSLVESLTLDKNKTHINNLYKLLITEYGKNNTMVGRTSQYKPVVLKETIPLGSLVTTRITEATSSYLVGNLI